MHLHKFNPDAIPTGILEADLENRRRGMEAADRMDALYSFVQKGAIICLAGILPLGAAREYEPQFVHGRGGGEGLEDDRRAAGGIPDGKTMDLSTLQDLVSGVGVILTSDFSLPRPTVGNPDRKQIGGLGGTER